MSIVTCSPDDSVRVGAKNASETEVTIIKYDSPELNGKGTDVAIELFPIDFSAVRRAYQDEARAGTRFEDFLAKQVQGKTPVHAQLDANGRAAIKLAQGNWFLHASQTSIDGESIEWRLPLTVTGSKQTVELKKENADEHSKKF
jgi:hypothetical protein